jgi:hypothetical protein
MGGGATPWTFMYALAHGYVSADVRASGACPCPGQRTLDAKTDPVGEWYYGQRKSMYYRFSSTALLLTDGLSTIWNEKCL